MDSQKLKNFSSGVSEAPHKSLFFPKSHQSQGLSIFFSNSLSIGLPVSV